MAHWSDPFVDVPYPQANCGELVERALLAGYGRVVQFPKLERPDEPFHRAAVITTHVADFARPIAKPHDGCGVLLLAHNRMAHIGLYIVIDGQPHLLHTDSTFGASTRVPMFRVQPPRYRIEGFYAWLD